MAIFDIPLENLRRRRSIKWARFAPDVLPLFVAEMDAKPVPAVVDVLSRMVAEGDTGYPELPDYQEAFASFASDVWGWDIAPATVSLACDVMTGMREMTLASSSTRRSTRRSGRSATRQDAASSRPPPPRRDASISTPWRSRSRRNIPPPTCCAPHTIRRGWCTPPRNSPG